MIIQELTFFSDLYTTEAILVFEVPVMRAAGKLESFAIQAGCCSTYIRRSSHVSYQALLPIITRIEYLLILSVIILVSLIIL
jgi:hypothetical protein